MRTIRSSTPRSVLANAIMAWPLPRALVRVGSPAARPMPAPGPLPAPRAPRPPHAPPPPPAPDPPPLPPPPRLRLDLLDDAAECSLGIGIHLNGCLLARVNRSDVGLAHQGANADAAQIRHLEQRRASAHRRRGGGDHLPDRDRLRQHGARDRR